MEQSCGVVEEVIDSLSVQLCYICQPKCRCLVTGVSALDAPWPGALLSVFVVGSPAICRRELCSQGREGEEARPESQGRQGAGSSGGGARSRPHHRASAGRRHAVTTPAGAVARGRRLPRRRLCRS